MSHEPPDLSSAFRGERTLITGGAGFIGSHLAAALCELGAHVRVLDDLSTGHESNLDGLDADLHRASILDDDALRAAMVGCRWVFHEAAMVSVPLSVEDPRKCAAMNITGTVRVLEAAREAGVHRVVFASSAAVYGNQPKLPSGETDPIDCWSPYAASKAAGEAALHAFAHCYDLDTVSLRYFNIFGPRQDPKSAYAAVIAAFVDALRIDRTPIIFGDGEQTRDFTPVANVVHANLLAATREEPLRGEVVNIGTGKRTSLKSLLATMSDALGRKLSPEFRPPRAGDVQDSVADITKARELLGYEPRIGLADGLNRLLAGT